MPQPLSVTLQSLIDRSGRSQRAIERAAGLGNGTLSRYLGGKRTAMDASTAARIADALECSVDWLLGREAARAAQGLAVIEPGGPVALPDGPVRWLPLSRLAASPLNPRKVYDDEALRQLADSIRADGLLQNLVVRQVEGGEGWPPTWEIIAGERRFRALRLLADDLEWEPDEANIPCRVVEADEPAARAVALLENLQRADLAPLEEAQAFDALRRLDPERWTTAAIAARIARTQRYVQQRLALLKLDEPARDALAEGRIGIEQARELAGETPERQREILEEPPAGGPAAEADPLDRELRREIEAVFRARLRQAMAGGTLADLLRAVLLGEIVAAGVPDEAARLLDLEPAAGCTDASSIPALWQRLADRPVDAIAAGAAALLAESLTGDHDRPLLAELARHYRVPAPDHWQPPAAPTDPA